MRLPDWVISCACPIGPPIAKHNPKTELTPSWLAGAAACSIWTVRYCGANRWPAAGMFTIRRYAPS